MSNEQLDLQKSQKPITDLDMQKAQIKDEPKKCQPDDLVYTSNPPQLRCKNCKCACHDKDRQPLYHDTRCCEAMNGYMACSSCEKRKKTGHICGIINQEKITKPMEVYEHLKSFPKDKLVNQDSKEETNSKDSIREEFISKFTVWNDKYKFATLEGKEEYPTPEMIADWFLSRTIPREVILEKIEELRKSSYKHNYGRMETAEHEYYNEALDDIVKLLK